MTKKLKKFLATLLAMSMILSMASVSAFATDGDEPASNEPVIEDVVTGDNNENTPEICETCGKALTECEGHEDQTDPADTSEENEEEEEEQSEEELCEHEWNEGEAVEGGTKYTCALCGETHVLADEDNSFDTDTLEENGEGNDGIDWAANEITIMTVDELIEFAEQVNGGTTFQGKTVTLGDDIDLSNEAWTPIGSNSKPFEGTFDGGGRTISNLNVTGDGYVGLFGYIGGNAEAHDLPEIRNLTVENVTVAAPAGNGVGGVVGNAFVAKVTNVHVTGTIDIEGSKWVGGIAGYGYVKIVDCSVEAEGNIKGNVWCVGGILGYGGEGTTTVENCTVEGTGSGLTIYSAYNALGGVVGQTAVNGAQHVTGSNLTVSNVKLESDIVWGNTNPGYFFGGSSDHELTGTLTAENVTIEVADEPAVIHDVVASVGSTYYASLQDAIDAAETGDTVTLLKDTNVDRTNEVYGVRVWDDCDITLDLNGKTLDGAIWNYGTLTITGNGTVDNTGNENAWPAVENRGKLTVENGSYTAKDGSYALVGYGTGSNITIKDGTFRGMGNNGGTVTIEDGEFNAHDTTDGYMVVALINWSGKVTVKGGTFTTAEGCDAFTIENDDKMTIDGGTVKNCNANHVCIANQDGDGTTPDLIITDGIFTGNIAHWNYAAPQISGGIFSYDVNAYVVEGSQAKEIDGVWVIVPAEDSVAAIGNKGYASLQAAIDAATEGETVKLLKNVTLESKTSVKPITINKAITLDLAGFVLTGWGHDGVNGNSGYKTIDVVNGGSLVVKSSDAEHKGEIRGSNYYAIFTKGPVTIESGSVTNVQTNTAYNLQAIVASGKNASVTVERDAKVISKLHGIQGQLGASVTINGGTVLADGTAIFGLTNNKASKGTVTINGGTVETTGMKNLAEPETLAAISISSYNLVLNGGEVKGTYAVQLSNYGVNANAATAGTSTFTMTGGSITATKQAVGLNNLTSAGTVATISGGTITAPGVTAIYWPAEGTLTIKDGAEISGGTGIEVKMGTINIEGGKITGTGDYKSEHPMQGGAAPEGSALLVSTQMYGHSDGQSINDPSITVNITGGEFVSEKGNGITVYNTKINNVPAVINISGNSTKVTGNAKKAMDKTTVENETENVTKVAISNGTFSSDVDLDNCDDTYLPIANGDGTYGVTNETLTITPNRTNQTGAGAVTLTVAPANLSAEVAVTCDVDGITLTDNRDGTWTTSRLPNRTVTYTFTVTVGTKTATCTVSVSYDAPYVPPVTEPDEDLGDEDTPLSERPWLFVDVKEGDYFYDAVKRLFDKGIVGGTTETTYEPYADATRGMVAQILYGMAGSPDVTGLEMPFSDVKESDFYYNAVIWAYANKVIGGYPDGTFQGERTISREELAAVLHQYGVEKLGLADTKGGLDGFIDADKISGWAVGHMEWAVGMEIMHGDTAKKLMPQELTIRADMTIMLNNQDLLVSDEK